ncbi:MAG: hypothetical protein KGJ84_05155 [Elusimicrobia bacterium]|nr:hypothetical protein [Elusimicrobiota bacterium]
MGGARYDPWLLLQPFAADAADATDAADARRGPGCFDGYDAAGIVAAQKAAAGRAAERGRTQSLEFSSTTEYPFRFTVKSVQNLPSTTHEIGGEGSILSWERAEASILDVDYQIVSVDDLLIVRAGWRDPYRAYDAKLHPFLYGFLQPIP